MSNDTWSDIQAHKNKQLSLREKLIRRRKERQVQIETLTGSVGGNVSPTPSVQSQLSGSPTVVAGVVSSSSPSHTSAASAVLIKSGNHIFSFDEYSYSLYGNRQGTLKTTQMANGPANRGSLFNVRHAVLHSLRRFLFFVPNVLYSTVQGSLLNVSRAIRRAVRHSPRHSLTAPFAAPFPIHFPPFSLFKLRYSMFAAPLAIRSSPLANRQAIRRAIRCRFSMSPDAFHSI